MNRLDHSRDVTLQHGQEALRVLMVQLQESLSFDMAEENNLSRGRQKISLTALEPNIVVLLLADDNHSVILANRYDWQGKSASAVSSYDPAIAAAVGENNSSRILKQPKALRLYGYFPVTLGIRKGELRSQRVGVLFVEYDLSRLFAEARNDAYRDALHLCAFFIALAVMLIVLLHTLVTRRVERLVSVMGEFAAGNLTIRSRIEGKSEIAQLATAFDGMAQRLAANEKELREGEEKIAASLREKETMLKEIHHRVKNNLQVISSLLNLQSEYLQDEKTRDMFRQSVERIRTMAAIHTQLYQSQDMTRIAFGAFIQDLIGNLLQSYLKDDAHVEIEVEADEIYLGIEQSISCGLILNELVSNAMKYAFPEGKGGIINVGMKMDGDQVILKVSDNGVGLSPSLDITNTQTLGLELVNLLVGQIGGKIGVRVGGGATFTISFPIRGDRGWQDGKK